MIFHCNNHIFLTNFTGFSFEMRIVTKQFILHPNRNIILGWRQIFVVKGCVLFIWLEPQNFDTSYWYLFAPFYILVIQSSKIIFTQVPCSYLLRFACTAHLNTKGIMPYRTTKIWRIWKKSIGHIRNDDTTMYVKYLTHMTTSTNFIDNCLKWWKIRNSKMSFSNECNHK